jgi:uncharacterized protein
LHGNCDVHESEFAQILNTHLRPSLPIESEEHLFGREHAIQTIRQAYLTPGRQIFVIGDRGVGKTSVARTAAHLLNPSTSDPVYVAASSTATFETILTAIHTQLVGDTNEVTSRSRVSVGPEYLQYSKEQERTRSGAAVIADINAAAAAIRSGCANPDGRRVIVIDEFDRLPSQRDRELFAELTKHLADTGVNAFVIFCGIGRDVDSLLAAHGSTHRYFDTINLPRLDYTARWAIVDQVAAALGIEVNPDSRFRIAAISDGFPQYVHLICLKMFWHIFNRPEVVTTATSEHYVAAVRDAVIGIEPELRKPYEDATMKNKDDYEPILWAAAAHFETARNTQAIFESYVRVMDVLGRDPLDRKKFPSKLN